MFRIEQGLRLLRTKPHRKHQSVWTQLVVLYAPFQFGSELLSWSLRAQRQGCVAFWHLWDLKYLLKKPPCYQMAGSSLHFALDRQQVRKKALKTGNVSRLLWLAWPQVSHSMSCSNLVVVVVVAVMIMIGYLILQSTKALPWVKISMRWPAVQRKFTLKSVQPMQSAQSCLWLAGMYDSQATYVQPFLTPFFFSSFGFVKLQSRWQVLFYS